MAKEANLSTVIDARIKNAITEYCKRKGLKLRYVVENALLEQIEDEIDAEAIRSRDGEESVPLENVLSGEF